MAALDSSIILGVKPLNLAQPDPIDRYVKLAGVQEIQGKLADQEQTRADDLATREAFKAGGTGSEVLDRLRRVSPKAAMAYETHLLKGREAESTISRNTAQAGKADWEVRKEQAQNGASLIGTATPDNWEQTIRFGILNKFWSPEAGAHLLQQGYSPQLVQQVQRSGITYAQQQEEQGRADTRAQTRATAPFVAGPNGPVAQPAVQAYEMGKSKAGAARTNIINQTGGSLANQVGPMMKENVGAAESAVKQVNAAQTLIRAIDSGKIVTGPMANERMTVSRIGQVLNVGGANEAEKLVNTQNAIRSLAQLTLQARAQMRGQGAVSETEGALAERAASGDIRLTATELRALAVAAEKGAREIYAEHTRNLDVMKADPELNRIEPFYRGRAMPPEMPATPAAPAAPGAPVSDTRQKADIIISSPPGKR